MGDVVYPGGENGRTLLKTPHEIAVEVAHHRISYGTITETMHEGYILKCIKRAIFQAVRDAIIEASVGCNPGAANAETKKRA